MGRVDSKYSGKRKGVLLKTVAAVSGMFVLFTTTLWWFGFFTFSGTETSAHLLAAALALVGGLIGSLVTLVGLVLNHSIEERNAALRQQTEARERIAANRSSQLGKDAERRLTLEASIHALSLLSSSSGQEVPDSQRAGVILTLGDLGMFAVGLSLTDQMLKTDKLDAGTACWLINKALTADVEQVGENVPEQAALMLQDNVEKMLKPHGDAVFPAVLLGKKVTEFPRNIRRSAVVALIDLLLFRPFNEWQRSIFFSLLDSLHYIWKHEDDSFNKQEAGVALLSFVQVYDHDIRMNLTAGPEKVSDVLDQLSTYEHRELEGQFRLGQSRHQRLMKWNEPRHKSQPVRETV